jgi:hypothetical protein
LLLGAGDGRGANVVAEITQAEPKSNAMGYRGCRGGCVKRIAQFLDPGVPWIHKGPAFQKNQSACVNEWYKSIREAQKHSLRT